MGERLDLQEQLTKRTQLGATIGLELVPLGVLMFVFGLGELGWYLGSWFMPTLGATAIAALVATVGAVLWRRRRYGLVKLRWDHRATALIVLLGVAHISIEATDLLPAGPLYLTGVTMGLALAAICLWSPYALAQHLVFGLLVAITSAIPLGAWIDMPVPAAVAADLGAQPHPLAVLQPLIVPTWLIVTGLAGHVRLVRALSRPVLGAEDADRSDAG